MATASDEQSPDYEGDTYDPDVGKEYRRTDPRPTITSPESAYSVLADVNWHEDREACVLLTLNTKHRVIDTHLVSLGSLDHTFMAPREIYRAALLDNAAAIVVAHNHPSADVTASSDDVAVTKRLVKAGEIMGVTMLDHLIVHVGTGQWASLARAGHV